jgi:hypothetical protein
VAVLAAAGAGETEAMKKILTLTLSSAALFLAAPAFADADKGLPADQVIAAIQAAVAAHPGQVKEVEVKDRRNQAAIVEVEIVAADGKKHEVKVDTATRQVVR